MMFIDYENFEIQRRNLYKKANKSAPRIDLVKLPKTVMRKINADLTLVKTFLFVPKPDEFLSGDENRVKHYKYLKGLENTNFFRVVSGRHVARPVNGDYLSMSLANKGTYYVTEKGTDINMAAHILTKAFHGSYDTAIVLSGDTDHLPIYEVLNTIGKTVIVVSLEGQSLSKLKTTTDAQMILDLDFLEECKNEYVSHKKQRNQPNVPEIDLQD